MQRNNFLAALTLAALLVACGQVTPEARLSEQKKMVIEEIAPGLPVVKEGALGGLSAENTKILREHTFSNGEVFRYITLEDKVIDGDMVLGTTEELQKAFSDYEDFLKGKLKSQGAMIYGCKFALFGNCFAGEKGRTWPASSYGGVTTVPYDISGVDSYLTSVITQAISDI